MAHFTSSYAHRSSDTTYTPLHGLHNTGKDSHIFQNNKRKLEHHTHEVTSPANGRRKLYKVTEWKWELFSWIVGTFFIAGIIYILVHFDNTPVEKWPIPIQISTVVAFLAQIAGAALMSSTNASVGQLKWAWFQSSRKVVDLQKFDEASRGPSGSLMLLFTLSLMPRLVHLGALITMAMLVFPTFFQQAVQTRLDTIESTAQQDASTTRLKLYNRQNISTSYSDDYVYHTDLTRNNPRITNNIISNMVGETQNLSDVRVTCPSGRCNWEPYTTIAICYETHDISDRLVEQAHNTSSSPFEDPRITLPGITIYDATYIPTMWTSTIFGNGNGTIDFRGMTADIESPDLQLTNPNSNLDDLAHIYLVYQDPCKIQGVGDYTKGTFKALKGTVRLCLQALKTSHNSSTDTTVQASFENLTWTAPNGTPPPRVVTQVNGNWTTKLGEDDFTIDYATTELIGGQLATSFNFSAAFITGGDNYLYGSMFATSFVSEIIGPDPLACTNSTEYGLPAFDKRIANIAIGLTNSFRTANESIPVYGKSIRDVLYIHVRYYFLAIPVGLFAAITVFFFATLLSTIKVPIWKSSQLAVLYTLHEPQKLGTKSSMEEEAEKMEMRFSAAGNWQLQQY